MSRTLQFTKMNGAGNDFVVVDNRGLSLNLSRGQIIRLCDRHRGVGADGLLAVEPARNGAADFRMRYYNADGGEAEMCGNGARCFARFVNRLHDFTLSSVRFETMAGVIGAEFAGDAVRVRMSDPGGVSLNERLVVNERELAVHSVNTGVPHAVVFVPDLESVDVIRDGAALRYHGRFAPKGTNANFVAVIAPGRIAIRTYERGVEGETLACGTGTVACALVHHLLDRAPPPVEVRVRGGDALMIGFSERGGTFTDVTLTGPGDIVFDGEITL
jgi:diaminopimelate epimerase